MKDIKLILKPCDKCGRGFYIAWGLPPHTDCFSCEKDPEIQRDPEMFRVKQLFKEVQDAEEV